jgi:ribose transport system substrate-binding protein
MKGTAVKPTRILVAAGACLAVVALAACSSSKPAAATSAATSPAASSANTSTGAPASSESASTSAASSGGGASNAPSTAKKNYKVSFVQGVAGDNFYITMQCGIQDEAKKLGVTVNTQGPAKFDPTLQKPIVDAVVASKPDGMLIAPTDVHAMQSPIDNAISSGIKVGLVDTTLGDPSKAITQVASDNKGGGAAAFAAIKQLVPNGGKVLVLSVKPGISTTDLRTQGFEEAVKADPSFNYLGVQYDNDDPTIAAQVTTAALQKDPDLVGIFATNLFSAEGAATGIKQAGKQSQVKIVGFDAGPAQIKDLKAGTVQALIAQEPYQIGVQGLDQLVNALNGDPATAKIQTGFSIITQQNVATTDAAYKASC